MGLGESRRPEDGVRLQKCCTGVGQARPQGSRLMRQVGVRTPSLRVQLKHVRGAGSRGQQPALPPAGLRLGQYGGHPVGYCQSGQRAGFQWAFGFAQLCNEVISDPGSQQT